MNPEVSATAQSFPLFVEQLRRHAIAIPDALAVRAPGGERSMAELVARSERIASRLREMGLRPGDRVSLIGRASLAWLDVMIGAMFNRCAIAPLSPVLTVADKEALLGDMKPGLIFAEEDFREGCDPNKTVMLEQLELWIAAGTGAGEPAMPEGDDLFSVIYSSGTTGVPKGIAHSARARSEFIAARPRPGFGPGRVAYVATSLYTNLSFLGVISPLYFGAAVSVASHFSVEAFVNAVEAEGITDVSLVPVQVKRILEHPEFNPDRLASIQFTMISGSPMDAKVKAQIASLWPGRVVDAYGSTETGGIATLDLKAHADKLDTVGPIMAGVQAAILDGEGKPLRRGEIGEIAASTPLPMEGYFNRQDLTDNVNWRDGIGDRPYIRTGDVGFVDEEGFLHITGRAKDMIISGGLNIYASDIEAVICDHPAVSEAAVIAIPDERWGECPYAVVVLRDGFQLGAEELNAWIHPRLARTSWPKGLEFMDALPRNALGKVLKRELREPFWRERDREIA